MCTRARVLYVGEKLKTIIYLRYIIYRFDSIEYTDAALNYYYVGWCSTCFFRVRERERERQRDRDRERTNAMRNLNSISIIQRDRPATSPKEKKQLVHRIVLHCVLLL